MAIGKGLTAFLAAYYKAKESASKELYQQIQLAYLQNKLSGKGVTGEDAQASAAGTAAQSAYDRGNVGGLTEGRSSAPNHPIGDPVAAGLAPHQRAFLNAVAAPESNGEYDRMYAGMDRSTPPTYFEGYDAHPDIAAAGPAGPSTAAGRYMFTKSTWDRLGGGSFDPANQDKRAWELAKQDYASRTGGRDLDTELRTNGFTPQIASTLSPTWQGFKANPSLAADTYYSSLNRYRQPQVAEGSAGGTESALPISPTGLATPALTAASASTRSDNMGQALPVEAGVTAPTPLAYAPAAYPQAIPVDYAGYDPYNTEAVYAAKGGLVPDLRQRWVQHFQNGGDVNGENDFYQQLGLPANFREQAAPFLSAFTGGNGQLGLPANFREQAAPFLSALRQGNSAQGSAAPVNAAPAPVNALPVPTNAPLAQAAPQAAPVVPRFNRPNFQNIRQRISPQANFGGMNNPTGNGFGSGNWGALNLGQGYKGVQHFQGGGEVEPYYPPQFTYVDPNAPSLGGSPEPPPAEPAQFTYVQPDAPWIGQPMVNNPYGDLVGPRGSPVGPQDFAPATTSASYSGNPYGALDVPDRPAVPLPPPRPGDLGAAPVGGSGGVRRVPLPPPRPDDLPDDQAPAGAQDQGWNGQLSPDNPIAQLLTGVEHAVSGGVRWLTKTLGFNNDAIPTNDSGLQALRNGDHALTEEEHDAVVSKVDPDNKLSPGVRNMVGMNAMYEYYLTHGSLDKAQKMAAGMLLYSEQYLRKSALGALSDPDPRSAAKKLADGFNQVPNNQHMTVDDNGNFVLKNETTGKVINAGRYNPQQLLAAATGAANGSVFWQSLSQFAHKDDEVDDKQTAAMKKAQQEQENLSNFHQTFTPGGTAAPNQAIPVGDTGFKALAPDAESATEDAGEGGEDTEEGRSASAGAPPKGAPRTATSAAYVGMKPALPDNFTSPEHWAAWDKLTPQQKALEQRFHELRVNTAAEAAKREAEANAPVPDANKGDAKAQGTVDKNVDAAWDAFTAAAEGKKNAAGEPFAADKIPASDIQGFKTVARGIVQKHGGSAADALDTTMSLVQGTAKQPVPTKKDDNGKDVIDWDKVNDAKPYITRTVKGDKWLVPRNEDGVPDPQAAVRVSYKGYNTLEKMTKAAIQNKFDAQQEAAKPGFIARVTPGLVRAGAAVPNITPPTPAPDIVQQLAPGRPAPPLAPAAGGPSIFGNAPATGPALTPFIPPGAAMRPIIPVPRRPLPVS